MGKTGRIVLRVLDFALFLGMGSLVRRLWKGKSADEEGGQRMSEEAHLAMAVQEANAQREQRGATTLQALRQIVGDLTEEAFAQSAKTLCEAVTRFRFDSDAAAPAGAMTDGFRASVEDQRKQAATRGVRTELAELAVDEASPWDSRKEADRFLVFVRFVVRRRVRKTLAESGALVEQDLPGRTVTEFWSLVRPLGAAPSATPAVADPSRCSGCSAPRPSAPRSTCAYCGTPFSAESDEWKVAGISATALAYQVL